MSYSKRDQDRPCPGTPALRQACPEQRRRVRLQRPHPASGLLAYNGLRLIGQVGLLGDISPVRHPDKRRRIKTVLQEIMYRAAQFIRKARKLILDFGEHCPAFKAVVQVQEHLLEAGQSP